MTLRANEPGILFVWCVMRLRWNTTSGLIVIVAASAVVLAVAVAIYAGRNNPLLGLGLVITSAGTACWAKMVNEVAGRQARGEWLSRWGRTRLLLFSIGYGFLTIGLSGLAFLVVFGMLTQIRWDLPNVRFSGLGDPLLLIAALISATLAGLWVCSLVRRAYSSYVSRRNLAARLLAPLAIVLMLVLGETMRQRVVFRLAQAAVHDEWVDILLPSQQRTGAPAEHDSPNWERGRYHVQMREKWQYSALHPWLAVEPDPPVPEPRWPSMR
jgi:hypothetical protein